MASEVPDEKYTEIASHGCLVSFETATAILRFVCILSKTVFSEFTTDAIETTPPAAAATAARMKKEKKIDIRYYCYYYYSQTKLSLVQ